ncbi:class A beta-lactamase [Roseateles sp. DC23W]|uniref:Beta-lactamase n=1 Tax=Pelomonas dachongensis TaxID=3299029 RepID=A0ABW7EVD6_9BURK
MSLITRRQALASTTAAVLLPAFTAPARAEADHPELLALERRAGGRLGVAVLDTASGAKTGLRRDERFGMCSTFKLPLAGLVLKAADEGRLALDQWVAYGEQDMVSHAPVTSQHLKAGGMTVGALAEATQVTSDNPAANLLITLLGGPAAITASLRALGDAHTRLDRMEPEMNRVSGDEVRDTTTPAAMARTTARMLRSDWLSPASRERLAGWMVATQTGRKRLRAGLPAAWRAGDKTGTAMHSSMADKLNDVAIAWPDARQAVVIAAYYDAPGRTGRMRDEDQAVLAEVGRIAAAWWQALPRR